MSVTLTGRELDKYAAILRGRRPTNNRLKNREVPENGVIGSSQLPLVALGYSAGDGGGI
ncbi:MAG: hypothetical protein NTV68_14020 [Methanomicrobiales archaeon]|nr:hypothetical protein [Methanomicrobiales archaeon]